MIFIRTNSDGKIVFVHYKPFDEKVGLNKTQEELEAEGILVDSIPEENEIEGKIATLYYSVDNGLYWKYEDEPKIETEEEIKSLKQSIADLTTTLTLMQTQ